MVDRQPPTALGLPQRRAAGVVMTIRSAVRLQEVLGEPDDESLLARRTCAVSEWGTGRALMEDLAASKEGARHVPR